MTEPMTTKLQEDPDDDRILDPRSAARLAIREFAIIFLCAMGWHLLRKTGDSVLDIFGEAALTALLLFFWNNQGSRMPDRSSDSGR